MYQVIITVVMMLEYLTREIDISISPEKVGVYVRGFNL